MTRDFTNWLSTFRDSISTYDYYVDFPKVHRNVENIKVELNILNSLIASKNIKKDFINLCTKYPNIISCIPILLAVRVNEIYAMDQSGSCLYNFNTQKQTIDEYTTFMEKTGLFDLLQNHIINNLVDYVTGIETGLDSNGRKNRGGMLMENLLESFILSAGFEKNISYFKEMNTTEIETKFKIDLSPITNQGQTTKKIDFVIFKNNIVYAIETNFYTAGGSKLNETARSYKNIALGSKNIKNFKFIWCTDGKGWISARNNLKETFDVLDNIYNITDLESGILKKI